MANGSTCGRRCHPASRTSDSRIHPALPLQHMADWEHIRAVKAALKIPVLGNGNVLSREDADRMMAETGVDGVLRWVRRHGMTRTTCAQ